MNWSLCRPTPSPATILTVAKMLSFALSCVACAARAEAADPFEDLLKSKPDRADAGLPWEEIHAAKKAYSLFRPTPRSLRREFLTDRPDKTLTPVTVDAGHWQVESDFVTYKHDRDQQPQEQGLQDRGFYSFALSNVRVGLTNDTDLHVIVQPFEYVSRTAARAGATVADQNAFGFGDMSVMAKHNLWGNDGGPTALGCAARVDAPTGAREITSGYWEGGSSIFWLRRLPGKTYFGLEFGIDVRENVRALGYHAEFLNSASLAISLTERLGTKAELASITSTEQGQPWEGIFAMALLYQPLDDCQLDVGINIGLTKPAADWNPYVGGSIRF
ncbi:MAG: transporter [Planctomycetes bacterium]|nr:transporter [Planctomycetota bacterium]